MYLRQHQPHFRHRPKEFTSVNNPKHNQINSFIFVQQITSLVTAVLTAEEHK